MSRAHRKLTRTWRRRALKSYQFWAPEGFPNTADDMRLLWAMCGVPIKLLESKAERLGVGK